MKTKLLIRGVIIFLIITLGGCNENSSDNPPENQAILSTSVSLNVQLENTSSQNQTRSVKSLFNTAPETSINSLDEIASISVSVEKGSEVLVNQQFLNKNSGSWQGVVTNLPVGESLTFRSQAFDNNDNQVLSGTTVQTLVENDTVTIMLGGDITVTIPAIKLITFKQEIKTLETIQIEFQISGPQGSELNYKVTPDNNGGNFNPVEGTILLSGSSNANLVINYTAPLTARDYKHSIVISIGSYSIETNFTTKVVLEEGQTGFNILFNPWITNFKSGPRIGSNVKWSVVASDDKPAENLIYNWKFNGNSQFSMVSFLNSSLSEATLINYNQLVTGTITLTITDGEGGSTVIKYILPAGMFPDCIVNCNVPTARAGNNQTIERGNSFNLDGSSSSDPGNLSLTYSWAISTNPIGSTATIDNRTTATPTFTPDIAGFYTISLTVSNGSSSDNDTVQIIVNETAINVTKPTLKLENTNGTIYQISLFSLSEHQAKQLAGVGNVGINCVGFSALTGLNGYVPTFGGFNSNVSITFNDTDGTLTNAGSTLALYTFSCTAIPSFNLGDTVSITYSNTSSITGLANINTVGP